MPFFLEQQVGRGRVFSGCLFRFGGVSSLVFAAPRILIRRASVTFIGRNRHHGRIAETSGRGRHARNLAWLPRDKACESNAKGFA